MTAEDKMNAALKSCLLYFAIIVIGGAAVVTLAGCALAKPLAKPESLVVTPWVADPDWITGDPCDLVAKGIPTRHKYDCRYHIGEGERVVPEHQPQPEALQSKGTGE